MVFPVKLVKYLNGQMVLNMKKNEDYLYFSVESQINFGPSSSVKALALDYNSLLNTNRT